MHLQVFYFYVVKLIKQEVAILGNNFEHQFEQSQPNLLNASQNVSDLQYKLVILQRNLYELYIQEKN